MLSTLPRLFFGLALWLIMLLLSAVIPLNTDVPAVFVLLFVLAPAVVVPLGLRTLLVHEHSALFKLLLKWDFVAACLCLSAFFWPVGLLSGLYVLPWVVICYGLAAVGGLRLLRFGIEAWEEVLLNAGLLFLAVGGSWLFMARLGLRPLEFSTVIVFLTAIHFHFAGFASCFILGASGRWLMKESVGVQRVYLAIMGCSIVGIPLLALGITFSPALEVLAGVVFALSLVGWSGLMLYVGLRQCHFLLSKGLLAISAVSILWSMFWALAYAVGTYVDQVWVSIPQMGWRHGLFNVLGYALPALLALALERPRARIGAKQIPWSQLTGSGFVGADFFERTGAMAEFSDEDASLPNGLVDDLDTYTRSDFKPRELPAAIRHFYEHTAEYALRVTPVWQPGFQTAGRMFRWVMDRLGQMALPVETEHQSDTIHSQILPLLDTRDGRQDVRAWVRTYADTHTVAYAAAYSQHRQRDDQRQVYMNIAFPLPYSQMTSVLRLDALAMLDHTQALRLSSLPVHQKYGDQGVYWVVRGFGVRLPINETIQVFTPEQVNDWPAEVVPQTSLLAQHDMWICGLHCLRLHYLIYLDSKITLLQ
jgi:hypothetical protein